MQTHDINARLGEIDAELETLAALTDPTEDDEGRALALTTEAAELRQARAEAIARTDRIAEAYRSAKQTDPTKAVPGSGLQHIRRVDAYDTDTRMLDATEVQDLARSILDRVEARHLTAGQKAKTEQVIGSLGERMARYFIAGSRPQYRSAWQKYITGNESLLSNDERRAVAEFRAAGLTDGSGGYAVPPLVDPSVIYTGDGNANPMRAISRIVTGLDNVWTGVSSAGITASWDAEGAEVSDDAPTLAAPSVTAYKGQAFVPFSVEIEGDWVGMAGEMATLFQEAKDNLESTAFATGSTPIGIVTALVAGSGTIANVTPTTDGSLGAVDIRATFAALPPRYRSNASWIMSIDVQNEVRGLDTSGGLSNQTVDLTAPYNFALLGRPVYENSAMDAFTGTTGVANLMVVGDFRNFVIFDRVGSRVEFIPHLFSNTTTRPSGQRGLLFWWRTGSDSVNDNAFRLLRNA